MSLRDHEIKNEYRSLLDDVVKDFYIPLLGNAVTYKRSVGFFSSTSLIEISKGIAALARNGGYIQLVASPYLTDEDIEAIKSGYEKRDAIVERALLRQLSDDVNDYYDMERLNLLANLIADQVLDIRIAYTEDPNGLGMYHEKLGLIEDIDNNVVAFSGSMNETRTAMVNNYETIDVFCNWSSDSDAERVRLKQNAFESIWYNCEPNITVVEFSEVTKSLIEKYRKKEPNYFIDEEQFKGVEEQASKKKYTNGPMITSDIKLYDYQLEAIDAWQNNNFKGIFDMATGTGKTLTGLGAVTRLADFLEGKLAVVIVCPYQHLVEQWVEDIVRFNIKPIIAYSKSSQRDWKKKLTRAVKQQVILPSEKFFCLVTTNHTFASDFVQNELAKIKAPVLLVADEAHNLGTERFLALLDEKYKYRLALSATLERHYDDEGTFGLQGFFGKKCIEYELERAINEEKLTPYKYYPILTVLNEDELEAFTNLSMDIVKHIIKTKSGKIKLDDFGSMLAIKRARLIAGAHNKIEELRNVIEPFKDSYYMLVYCGATKVDTFDNDSSEREPDAVRQIEVITKMLGIELGMNVAKFTADENIYERNSIKEHFQNGRDLQAIVAIKCLDEGVNIPAIQKAFILASTTNPKEYIQRRGRVLRRSPETGKEYAEIYDFITLPRQLDETYGLTIEQVKREASLARNEVKRMKEFSRLALNPAESFQLIDDIMEAYKLYESEDEEDFLYE